MGSTGADVTDLEKWMTKRNFYKGAIDGRYGPKLRDAVKLFQKTAKITVDGVVGPETRKAMERYGAVDKLPAAKPIPKPPAPAKSTPNKAALEAALGVHVRSAADLYSAADKKIRYKSYKNDIFDNKTCLGKIRRGEGINCTDGSQLLRPVLLEMGYNVRLVRGDVICNGSKYGHVWLQISGREYKNWVNYDITATTMEGKNLPLGALCCNGGYNITHVNPAWAMARDNSLV